MVRSRGSVVGCRLVYVFGIGIGLSGGACGSATFDADAGADDADAGQAAAASGTSKGGSISINDAGDTMAVANKATDDVTLFALPDLTERARVAVGDEPVSVSWAPDGSTLYVVNRASQDVSVVRGAETASPSAEQPIAVGSEPGQAALSPTGATLYVSNWADGTLSVIDTASRDIETLVLGGAPYAVCATNDGDTDDSDETIFVTDFYSRPIANRAEATDRARSGRVFRVSAGDLSVATSTLTPLEVTGITAEIDAADTGAYPNQLYSCAVNGAYVYITSVNASPEAFNNTTDFHQNIQGAVHVLAADTGAEVPERTVNLNELVTALDAPKRFVAVPHDIAFVDNSDFGYIASMASNSVLRVDFGASPPRAGSPNASFLETGFSPTGVAIDGDQAYAYNEVGRSVSHIDLATQTTTELDVESAPQPSTSGEQEALKGQRFFNTGQARWSTNGWVACVACHPFGTTDNVTFVFPAGPRQVVDTSATFDRGGTTQRILNWTAIFDEVHDFELNTRGVAGGTGAIVSDSALDPSSRVDFVGPGGVADPANGFNVGSAAAVSRSGAVPDDWDAIEAYIRTIRSPRGAATTAGDPVAGRAVFESANCDNCHGGPLWTLSERYYTPRLDGDLRQITLAAAGVSDTRGVRTDLLPFTDTSLVDVIAVDANGPPHRHSCTIRTVGTFDARGPDGRGAAETRQNGGNAQGVDGFNVPSLLNANMGAPYLHNGAAETLEDLLDPDGEFTDHLRSGNLVFAPTDQELADLVAFLRTIDDDTPTIDVPADQRICPVGVQPPVP